MGSVALHELAAGERSDDVPGNCLTPRELPHTNRRGMEMRFRLSLLAVAAALAVAPLASSPVTGGATAAAAAVLAPAPIREPFTLLPCTGKPNLRDTLQQEGCAEQEILRTDARINRLTASIAVHLQDNRARRRFIAAQRAWLDYRHADCLSRSDIFEGGTQAAVIDAECVGQRNRQRVRDLRTFLSDLGG
jgi:uncharacterized protein YecT (DUF1311 family)